MPRVMIIITAYSQPFVKSRELGVPSDQSDVGPKHSLQIMREERNGGRNRARKP